jgi:GAF domain-containing protein/anti-sigma regulatory factor (Ser/Thr protein kinase)
LTLQDNHRVQHSFPLGDEPDAVPSARRLVREVLHGAALSAESLGDLEVVVTELVSNALMYAGSPVLLRLEPTGSPTGSTVRIEVEDRSPVAPLRPLAGTDSMTGRGLALVSAMSDRWGVHPVAGGKVVWAEIDTSKVSGRIGKAGLGVDELLAAWPEVGDSSGTPRVTVTLGDVPTELLLAAKAHVDNVVREFTLAQAGAESGSTAEVTPDLARLIQTVTTRFAEARRAIKAQALQAVAAGHERTRLVLTLPVTAADAGREYLSALDEVDAYARAARLLTLESAPEHRAFRRWYVTALVDQLGAASRGEQASDPPSFERFLLDELGTIASAKEAADRAARLQSVTASLAGATSLDEVADVVISEGVAALGASGGGLFMPGDGDQITVPGTVGYGKDLVARMRAERRDTQLPAAVALSTGDAVWLESREERDARFPELTGLEPTTVSMCAVPLRGHGHTLGALRFSFDRPRLFGDDERQFVEALAAQTALAVDRAQLRQAEGAARHSAETIANRLTRLHRVTAALAGASTFEAVARAVVDEAAVTLGAVVSALSVLDGDTLHIVGLGGGTADAQQRWESFPLAAELPASEAVRTNAPVVVRNRTEMDTRYPSLRGYIMGDGTSVSVPVTAGSGPLGALTLRYPVEQIVDDDELELLATIARQCGVALERARLFAAERSARDRSTFLAEAAGVLGSSLDPVATLRNLTGLLIPRFGDWAVVYLKTADDRIEFAGAAHRNPELTRVMVDLQSRNPLDVSATDGVAEVLRSGRSVRYGSVPDSLRRRATGHIEDAAMAASFTPTSGLAVALTVRDTVLGAVAVARTEGAAYTVEDLALLEDVAGRAAVAIDNAESYRRERDAALTLQRSLLPQRLPLVPGVSFAWRYLPGTVGTRIGGDWYDVIPLEHGRVGLVIGDVMGRGLRAAALMGQLRATARAHASTEVGPAEVLRRLDAALGRLEQDQITTALFALLDPATGSLTVATAGHLPPLLAAGGTAGYLDVTPGPPLGAGAAEYPELEIMLPPEAMVLLYTDGLVEDRALPVDQGMEKLRLALDTASSPEQMCDRALAALGRDAQHDDDTAMLAVALHR